MFNKEALTKLCNIAEIEAITPRDFEWFSKFLMEHLGYEKVFVTEKHGEREADGGVDLTMFKGEKIYVQCKHLRFGFNGNILPVKIIRELGGCMLRDKVNRGIVITTLEVDELGKREADKMNIGLIGQSQLIEYMKTINPEFNVQKKVGLLRRFWNLILGIIGLVILFIIVVILILADFATLGFFTN